jgi:hypothetical protein
MPGERNLAMSSATARLVVVAGLALAPMAAADFTNFDSFEEGFYGKSYEFDGITVFDVNNVNGVNPDGQPFTPDDIGTEVIIEDSTYLLNDYPEAGSLPNMLTFGSAYVNGPNLSLGALATASFTTGQTATSASFILTYYDEWVWDGIEVTLDALLNGQVVSTQSFNIVGKEEGDREIIDVKPMSVAGVTFDTLRIHASLNGTNTTFRAMVDNLAIESAGDCYPDFDGDGALDLFDFLAFVNSFNAGEGRANCDGQGGLDLFDFLCYTNEFNAGC